LVSLEGDRIFFRWKDFREGEQQKVTSLEGVELFADSYLMHAVVEVDSPSSPALFCSWSASASFSSASPVYLLGSLADLVKELTKPSSKKNPQNFPPTPVDAPAVPLQARLPAAWQRRTPRWTVRYLCRFLGVGGGVLASLFGSRNGTGVDPRPAQPTWHPTSPERPRSVFAARFDLALGDHEDQLGRSRADALGHLDNQPVIFRNHDLHLVGLHALAPRDCSVDHRRPGSPLVYQPSVSTRPALCVVADRRPATDDRVEHRVDISAVYPLGCQEPGDPRKTVAQRSAIGIQSAPCL